MFEAPSGTTNVPAGDGRDKEQGHINRGRKRVDGIARPGRRGQDGAARSRRGKRHSP